MNSSNKQKHGYLIHTWSDKALRGTMIGLYLRVLLEIKLTEPLKT